jgi:hypothetical protein
MRDGGDEVVLQAGELYLLSERASGDERQQREAATVMLPIAR